MEARDRPYRHSGVQYPCTVVSMHSRSTCICRERLSIQGIELELRHSECHVLMFAVFAKRRSGVSPTRVVQSVGSAGMARSQAMSHKGDSDLSFDSLSTNTTPYREHPQGAERSPSSEFPKPPTDSTPRRPTLRFPTFSERSIHSHPTTLRNFCETRSRSSKGFIKKR